MLVGSVVRECLSSGLWSGTETRCLGTRLLELLMYSNILQYVEICYSDHLKESFKCVIQDNLMRTGIKDAYTSVLAAQLLSSALVHPRSKTNISELLLCFQFFFFIFLFIYKARKKQLLSSVSAPARGNRCYDTALSFLHESSVETSLPRILHRVRGIWDAISSMKLNLDWWGGIILSKVNKLSSKKCYKQHFLFNNFSYYPSKQSSLSVLVLRI